jgi:hypothetical protein
LSSFSIFDLSLSIKQQLMKSIFLAAVTGLFILALPSCKQCTECDKYPEPTIKLCKKDFPTEQSYNDVYRQTVGMGYDCD